jgi:hypothetical protein
LIKEPTTVMRGRLRLAGLLIPAASLLALAAWCFARLIVEPGGLIVDGRRPSVDYANRADPRSIGNDLVFLFLPHHWSIWQRLAHFGHWPAWDARGFGGRPLSGNPQGGMLYPPVWAAWWLQAPAALGWLTVGHLLWGGLGVYVLVRAMGQGGWAATVAAGVYQASPLLLAHTFEGHYPHVWAVCWYPWAFWAFRDYRNGRARGLLLLPLILALTYLTGHPQEWLLLVLALSIWATWDLGMGVSGRVLCEHRDSPGLRPGAHRAPYKPPSRLLVHPFKSWFAILALSVGMVAVDLTPQIAVRPWLRRNHDPALEVGIPRRYHVGGLNLFQLLNPIALGGPADYFGDDNYWETVFSIGVAGLTLAVIAAARHPDRQLVRGWLILAGMTIAFACGRSLGLYPLIYSSVPGMAWFRVPARSLFLANLAAAVLAGLGIETLRLRMADLGSWRRFATRFAVASVILVSLLFLIQLGRVRRGAVGSLRDGHAHRIDPRLGSSSRLNLMSAPAVPPTSRRTALASARVLQNGGFWFSMVSMAALAILGCQPVGDRGRRLIGSLIGLVAMIELGWSGSSLIHVTPADRFMGSDPISARLTLENPENGESWGGTSATFGPVRIKARDSFFGDLPAAAHGIEKTNVDDAFQLDHSAVLYETLYPVASRVRPMSERLLSPAAKDAWRRIRQAVFDRMSVTHVVSDRVELDPGWPVAAEGSWNGSPFVIQRNPTAMPRAYVVPRATILPDHAGVVLTSLSDLDPHDSVVMSADPLGSLPPRPRQPYTPAEWTSTDPDRPALLVTTGAPGLLVVADTWMLGWTATVDGRTAPVLRGNQAQRVIPLPGPGLHHIVMEYRPPGFLVGLMITVHAFVVWVVMAGFLVCRNRGSRRDKPVRDQAWLGPIRRYGRRDLIRIPAPRH